MTSKQRAHYFRDLWPAACQRQGWDPKNEGLRRDVTLEAVGKPSTSGLSEHQITRLFEYLRLLADPDNLDRAIPVANPDVSAEEDACRRLRWVIENELMPAREAVPPGPYAPHGRPAQPAFADTYVQRCALGFCRAAKVEHWQQLPSASLEKLRFTLNQRRQQKSPDYQERGGTFVPYRERKSTHDKRAAAREPQVVPRVGASLDSDLMPF